MATTNGSLAAAAREYLHQLDDPLDVLELVHAAAAHLAELAGPSLVVTIAPAGESQQDVEVGAGCPDNGVKRQSAPPSKPLPPERPAGAGQKQDHAARKQLAADRIAHKVEDAKAFMVRAGREVAPREIREALGFKAGGDDRATAVLRQLGDDPDVIVTGQTRARRLSLRPGAAILQRRRVASEAMLKSRGGARDAKQEPLLEGQIMSALVLERTTADVAEVLDVDIIEVRDAIQRLQAAGDVVARPGHRWLACP